MDDILDGNPSDMAEDEEGKILKGLRGITLRWVLNAILPLAVIIVVLVCTISIVIYNYYNTTVLTNMEYRAKAAADFVSRYMSETSAGYYDTAYGYTESFQDANSMELQFLNSTGRVVVSSYAIRAGLAPDTKDVADALSTGEMSHWRGYSKGTGEHILAVSAPVTYANANGQVLGVMRYVTSLKLVDREITKAIALLSLAGVFVVVLMIFVGMFFIRSVVDPIREITKITRRIAAGSYGIQITKSYHDEIGVMVDTINEMSSKVSQTEKMQTEFISSVSHELRTPLTAITGWGETLSYGENLDGETRRGISIILKEARRLTKMVEELLEFTRMQDGRFTLNVEKIDVGVELEDSIFTYRELLKQDEIELVYEPYEEELPLVDGDPERLKQVFLNLLDNAAKYGRDGKRIIVSMGLDSQWVSISIRDFGPGVPEDELDRVKMKFYKGQSRERGSGIGLAVCDEIVKYHGGQLVLQNAEGGGLLATVKLPLNSHEAL